MQRLQILPVRFRPEPPSKTAASFCFKEIKILLSFFSCNDALLTQFIGRADRQGRICPGLWQKTLEWLCSGNGVSVAPALMARMHLSRWVCLFDGVPQTASLMLN